MLQIKRIYEDAQTSDGFRVLVDRLWPRGISKEKAKLNLWLKDIAPSTQLRKWFGHDPKKWEEFVHKYKKELHENKETLALLKDAVKKHATVTLLYGARDTEHNEAKVIADLLKKSE